VQSLDVVVDLGWEDDHLRRTLRSGSLVELLEEEGRHLARAEATLSAVVASADQARALSVAPGVPLLLITQLLFDQDGQLVGYSEDSYRTDLMTFRVVRRRGPRFDDTAGRDRIE
jgi:DNA-binding GntR family transcriptional regulator